MPEADARSLHLHTLDSLLADLVSGRPVVTGAGKHFVLEDDRTRSALNWYRKKGAAGWGASVSTQHGEDLVNNVLQKPPQLPALLARSGQASNRRLRLKKLVAHRFAGLHKFGTPATAPGDYSRDFSSSLTLFEGRNGSGKTSLLNAIIWALTGEILRPQREPEVAADFDCNVSSAMEGDEPTSHKLSSLTPMPNVEQYRPDQPWVPADTWVELTFVDDKDAEVTVRRSQSRSLQGKLKESPPDLSLLGVDPIAIRIGSIMPGLLPLIKVGSESELGRAVSQLTGLASLVDLADHVRRAKSKIEKDFVKAKAGERDRADSDYGTAKRDLETILSAHPSLAPAQAIPSPSADESIEQSVEDITKHFETAKANAFRSARAILGERFDPNSPKLLTDLEKSIGAALVHVRQLGTLPSAGRLNALRQLKPEQLEAAINYVRDILAEAETLDAMSRNPSAAARTRLYARVAAWIADHPDSQCTEDSCVVCGGALEDAIDPVTGQAVKKHLHEADSDAVLLSQTLGKWAESSLGNLMRTVPESLRAEIAKELPEHPCDLLRAAIVDELFEFEPFGGVLGDLKVRTCADFVEVVKNRSDIDRPLAINLPKGCEVLANALTRLDCALRFARWRQDNDALIREIVTRVVGRVPKEGEPAETLTLTGKLLDLDATVKAARPVSDSLTQCGRLKQHLKLRRAAEKRIDEYGLASTALGNLVKLGELADEQVDQLRKTLRKEAAVWRSRIYLGAFPDTSHELIDTGMGRKGKLDLLVRTGGVSAPAQHVSNASALRASLVAFFFSFWEYVLKERGGLVTLVLDDPQELLDDENRERLAGAFTHLVDKGAQVIVTSYDPRFCARISRLPISGGIEHLEVHPATRQQPVVRTTPPLPIIEHRKAKFDKDRNAEEPARNFADSCRVFFEAKLGDMFDDPAHAAWAIANPDPTLATFLQRLRPLVKSGPQGMFSAHVFRRFAEHRSLTDGAPVILLMNKAHHGRRQEIRAGDVAPCADDLNELLQLVEQMYEECYRWRRRDAPKEHASVKTPVALVSMTAPALNILVCPDLAAFTQHAPSGQSQAVPEHLDPHLLDNAVAFYLRRDNFGFAAPAGALALAEAVPGPAADRRLVIARHGESVYARRILRSANAGIVGLTAEIPDPRTKTPKTVFFPELDIAIHQVIGIIFDHTIKAGRGQEEAVPVDASDVLKRIEIAFRVIDDSAVPLALENQVVLGGAKIELGDLSRHKDALVALALDDGSSIFKRVGACLPGELSHLRQFESIGGLGSSQILSIGKSHKGFQSVTSARTIIGVLYHG